MKFLGFFPVYLTLVGTFITAAAATSTAVKTDDATAAVKADIHKITTASVLATVMRAFANEETSETMHASSSDGLRVQQRELAGDDLLRSAGDPDDMQEHGECELDALVVLRLEQNNANVATDGFEVTVASAWSIGNSESLDEGEVCGDVSDRTTSVAAFDSAFRRLDGRGFGNLLFYRVDYLAAGTRGEVDTAIQSSMVSSILVSSLGGNVGDVVPDTMFYGPVGQYFSAHVNFAARETDSAFSLPLLFHTPSQCQGANATLDFYGAAASGFADEIGGSIDYFPVRNETGGAVDLRFVTSSIFLDDVATLTAYVANQIICDVFAAPSYGPAAWAECSAGTQYVNTSVSVDGCEVLVSPARLVVVGDFFNMSAAGFSERFSLWLDEFEIQQIKIIEVTMKALSARGTASSGVTQTTTSVGFELEKANDSTEWILILIVALEVVIGVVALAVSSLYDRFRTTRTNPGSNSDGRAVTFGKVALVAVLLVLGLIPVFVARRSESDAAGMAHNDVHAYSSDTSACFPAVWEGGNALDSWCSTTRVYSQSLLVRSYSGTFLQRYNKLWYTATTFGGVGFVVYAVLSAAPFFLRKTAPNARTEQGVEMT